MEVYAEDWKRLYEAALLEPDDRKRPQRIADAESAIITHIERLNLLWNCSQAKALRDALTTLQDLRTLAHT